MRQRTASTGRDPTLASGDEETLPYSRPDNVCKVSFVFLFFLMEKCEIILMGSSLVSASYTSLNAG